MSYCIKIRVKPSDNKNLKFYVYRSKNANDINTISKVRTIVPLLIIDEANYLESNLEDGNYVVYDSKERVLPGVDYIGPEPVAIPATEYETVFTSYMHNDYTSSAILKLVPLEITYNGIMYYYSVIGVDSTNNLITHLSQVKAEILLSDYQNQGTREILACDNYTGFPDDDWHIIATPDWNTEIIFGDINNPITYNRYGTPFVSDVKIFNNTEIEVDTRCAMLFNHIVIKIPNIWRLNNTDYNYRKLKSFKIRNIYDNKYGEFSEPTYQSSLPVSNEKILIYKKDITLENISTREAAIDITETDLLALTIIRKDGLYYNSIEHKKFGCNKYNIDEKEQIAIFNESSVQKEINIDFDAVGGATYNYTFYIQDIYGKYSEPCVLIIET